MWNKLMSGRWLLTLACGFVFIWASVRGSLPPAAVASIITSVFTFYFIQGQQNDTKPKPPAPPAAIVAILLCLIAGPAFADVSVNDVLTKAGAKEGVMYDIKNQRGLNFLAATIYERQNFSVVAGLVSTDGVGVAADYNLGKALPVVNYPILSLVNSLHAGIGGYCRTITAHTDPTENSKADNKWGWGPTLFLKWNF